MFTLYPEFGEVSLQMRDTLHPLFKRHSDGVSEFTFANIYLFRKAHSYRIARLEGYPPPGLYVITGEDNGERFAMLPFGIPHQAVISQILKGCAYIKGVSRTQVPQFTALGLDVREDRDNFDYLYLKEELADLKGRRFHRKKNLVNAFVNNHTYEGRPLLEEYQGDALEVIERWRREHSEEGDCEAAREAIEKAELLSLCGGIYYVDGEPAAYSLGEEIAGGNTFVVHFEKAVGSYKGLYQFINMSFASILPDKYLYINREQDLGIEGLRHAKMSYNPHGFIQKYRVYKR
jgi:hypothetical protein